MTGWRGPLVAAAGAAVLAAATTWLVMYQPTASDDAEDRTAQYPLESVAFTDPQSATLTLHPGMPRTLGAPTTGIVTADHCTVGETLTTGDVITEIDQRPRVIISTEAPLFRDLAGDERGADVEDLKTALAELGYSPSSSASYDWNTRNAVNAFLADRGIAQSRGEWGILSMSDVIWTTPGETTIEECMVAPGDAITDGEVLLHLSAAPGTIDFRAINALVDGDRELVVGEVRVPASEAPLTDPESVRAILATAEGRAALSRDEKSFGATLELTESLTAYPVPPSALFGIDGSSACIGDLGTPHPVSIVSSSLGLTYVTFSGEAPEFVDVFPAPATPCA